MNQTELTEVIQRFTSRYRRALLANAGVLVVLSLGSAGLLAWRLQAQRLSLAWRVGLPVACALIAMLALVWWVRRRWISRAASAAYLDQALGLEQRLVTASEFATVTPPAPLYPLLLDDAAQRVRTDAVRLPRPFDQVAAALGILLLLILLWPGRGQLLQVATLPPETTLRPPPPPPPPPVPPPQEEPRRQDQTSGTPSGAIQPQPSQGQAGDRSSASQRQASQQASTQPSPQDGTGQTPGAGTAHEGSEMSSSGGTPQAAGQQPSGASANSHAGSESGQAGSDQASRTATAPDRAGAGPSGSEQPSGQTQQAGSTSPRGEGGEQAGNRQPAGRESATSGQGPQSAGDTQRRGARGSAERRSTTQHTPQQANAGTAQSPASSGSQSQAASTGGQEGGRGGERPTDTATASQPSMGRGGTGLSSGNEEALKADIQTLLKELSGELKQLEAQLAQANDQARPEAGSSTDPALYESSSPMGPGGGGTLPIGVRTDTVKTAASRPGGGVGRPSGSAAAASPGVQAEEAQLSEAPLEETPAARQVVPPEYRSVFERLGREHPQPSETKP